MKAESTQKQLKLIPLKNKVKTIATVSFMNKVKVLCSKIRDVEWSGVLFYSVKGSISNPEKLTITLEDILLMDKGTKTLTEYNFDNDESLAMDLVDLLQKSDTHRLTYKRGLIHSHNTMPVFFSGTDNEELINGAITHNYYLSVIVNSFGDITGKISFKSKTESKIKIISSDEKGKSIVKYRTAKEEVIHSYDCEIEDMTTVINNDFGFLERIDFIIEKRKLKEEEERKKNVITQPSFLKNENKNQFKNENYFGKTRNDYVFPNSNFNPKSSTTSIADAILGIEDDDLLSDDDVIVNINSEQINFAGYCLNDKNLELKLPCLPFVVLFS